MSRLSAPLRKMKRRETTAGGTDTSPVSPVRTPRNISVREAKIFWQNQRKEGTVDVVFKEVQSKVQLLYQKIKDGAATNQDYVTALTLVNAADLEDSETFHCDQNFAEELPEDEENTPVRAEEPCPIKTDLEKTSPHSESESSEVPPPLSTKRVLYEQHSCGPLCLSSMSPYFSKRENPLKFPVMCHFQRRHAKPSLISRPLDVIYKTPCGTCLRDFDDVHSYLLNTKCRFLSLANFSFNTYLQLGRNLVKSQVAYQDADISRDAELVPVPVCNEIDKTRPAFFTYRKSPWPRGYTINNFTDLFIGCCDCADGCLDVLKCACLQLTAKERGKDVTSPKKGIAAGYKYKRLQTPVPTGLYECNVSCKCDRKMCQNRVVQHGLQVRLQVFKTKGKGWGVRCLDDLDKGTFVCIYAGRILMKTGDVNTGQNTTNQTHAKKTTTICTGKKRRVSHSDSEITASPSISSFAPKFRLTPLVRETSQSAAKRNLFRQVNEEKVNCTIMKRPNTKTSILQKRRRQLMKEGTVTVQHSSDDEIFTPPASPKGLHPGEREHNGPEDNETAKMVCEPMGNSVLKDEAGYVSDESSSSVQCGTEEKPSPPDSNMVENIYFLDASKEGNVARFLNHSCSPNLFVQHVFVETHSKNFPWVAFFTKSFIKAGTELTWDYNYDVGNVPETEISCLCGHKKCKNKII
ncbi:histone-lysine N-methyltransferase SETDB2 isoform 2-T2 [Anomaloglossus baeobatrachus]|uniref:histone-lysine N-methyltransferase SETDB2 isoform X2 n=1 Tax=Anomaloglossus baeobatrachus TaxID=238106 RepID=UPI003F4FF773